MLIILILFRPLLMIRVVEVTVATVTVDDVDDGNGVI